MWENEKRPIKSLHQVLCITKILKSCSKMSQESKHLTREEIRWLATLMPLLQSRCPSSEARMILQMAKDAGVRYKLIHEVASKVAQIQSLEEMGLD
jgi:hypothetical protein